MFATGFLEASVSLQLIIIVIAIGGNLLVCYAVLLNNQLRMSPTSLFIFSLAVADILTASFPMSFEVDIMLKKGRWIHGETLCNTYTTMYLVAAPSSVLNLMAVSVDRYLALSRPLHYKHGRLMTMKKAFVIIVIIWLYSILTALFPVMGWHFVDGPSVVHEVCKFNIAYSYSIFISFLNFVVPLIVTCILNALIYRISCIQTQWRRTSTRSSLFLNKKKTKVGPLDLGIKRRSDENTTGSHKDDASGHSDNGVFIEEKDECEKQTSREQSSGTFTAVTETPRDNTVDLKLSCIVEEVEEHKVEINCDSEIENVSWREEKTKEKTRNTTNLNSSKMHERKAGRSNSSPDTTEDRGPSARAGGIPDSQLFSQANGTSSGVDTDSGASGGATRNRVDTGSSAGTGPGTLRIRLSDGVRNLKAAKTILLIVSCFTVCWIPHTALSLVGAFCGPCVENVSPEAAIMLLMLAYANSCCNPFIYTYHRRDFRQTFKRILRFGGR